MAVGEVRTLDLLGENNGDIGDQCARLKAVKCCIVEQGHRRIDDGRCSLGSGQG